MEAVAACNLGEVKEYIALGADVNYTTFEDSTEPNGYIQPTTPLRMVIFRLSDSLLTDHDLSQLKSIAEFLLLHKANPKPAIQIAEFRYGTYNPRWKKNTLKEIWEMIATATNR